MQVLLTLYANVAERFTSEPDNEAEEGSEATAGAGAAAGVGGSRQLDAAALDADAAFAAALARLQEQQELAAEDPAVAHLAQLAAQQRVQAVLKDVRAGRLTVREAEEALREMEREVAPPGDSAVRLMGLRAAGQVRGAHCVCVCGRAG
jgi:hypothetical protein